MNMNKGISYWYDLNHPDKTISFLAQTLGFGLYWHIVVMARKKKYGDNEAFGMPDWQLEESEWLEAYYELK